MQYLEQIQMKDIQIKSKRAKEQDVIKIHPAPLLFIFIGKVW